MNKLQLIILGLIAAFYAAIVGDTVVSHLQHLALPAHFF